MSDRRRRPRRNHGSSDLRRASRRDSPASSPRPSSPRRPAPSNHPSLPPPAMEPSVHTRTNQFGTQRSSNARLQFGPWEKGKSWSTAVVWFSISIIVSCCSYVLGVTAWAVMLFLGGLILALLITLSTGLSDHPHGRGRHDVEEEMARRGWFRSSSKQADSSRSARPAPARKRSLWFYVARTMWHMARLMMRPALFLTFRFADLVLTLIWRLIRRSTRSTPR